MSRTAASSRSTRSTQVPHHIRRTVAEQLGMAESALRLIAPDVGGGFGYKGKLYPEETIVAWAARRLRRPVKWVATRSRELHLRQPGPRPPHPRRACARPRRPFPRAAGRYLANLGAYVSTFGAAIPSAIYSALLAGVYRTPAIFVQSDRRVHQHAADRCLSGRRPARSLLRAGTACRDRGAEARHRSRRDPAAQSRSRPRRCPTRRRSGRPTIAAIFRKSFLARWRSPTTRASRSAGAAGARDGSRLRHGLLCGILGRRAVALRRRARRAHRLLRGGDIRVQPDGGVQLLLGTHNHGQGHATTFAQIIATRLGVPLAKSRSSKATPTRCLSAPARSARARSRSAARRSTAPPTRSSPRAS